MVGLILGFVAGLILLSWRWVEGVDHTDENQPEYKGDDFLDWDDNKSHTENF